MREPRRGQPGHSAQSQGARDCQHDTPTVTGRVFVDWSDFRLTSDLRTYRDLLWWALSDCPDRCEVIVRVGELLPGCIESGFPDVDRVPVVSFIVEGPDPRTVAAAVNAFRRAVDGWKQTTAATQATRAEDEAEHTAEAAWFRGRQAVVG